MSPELVTLGHGTATASELGALIREAGITSIVDVRKMPASSRHPHFGRAELERWLPADAGCAYAWEPALGGFRKGRRDSANTGLRHASFRAYADYMETAEFAAALAALLDEARVHRAAILCSETLWWRCHRRLIADAAVLREGFAVRHLMHDGTLRPHVPTGGVQLTPAGMLRYDEVKNF